LAAVLDSHATLEEELLFSALKPHLTDDKLISEMYAEHKEIQAGLERIEDARDIREAVDAVQETLSVARRHFRKEEEVLYSLARRKLDDEVQAQLGEAWAAARKVFAE
jgi:hemerythrin-like domain-containing protein